MSTAYGNTGGKPANPAQPITAWRRRMQEAKLTLRLLLRSPLAATGLVIVFIYAAIAIYAEFVPYNETVYPPTIVFQGLPLPPFWWPGGTAAGGLLGTTGKGIPLDINIVKAIRIDLMYSAFVVLSGAVIGTVVGVYSGYKGKLFDEALMRVTDITYSIPFLVLVIAAAFVFGRSDFFTLNLILMLLWWPPYARLVRAQALSVKELRFVEAARAAGASDARIILRHVLPNTLAPVFVQISLDMGTVTQVFAALFFIGVMANTNIPELGNLIVIGDETFPSFPWTIIIPGVVLLLFTVGVNLLGDGLRDVLDPRLRR